MNDRERCRRGARDKLVTAWRVLTGGRTNMVTEGTAASAAYHSAVQSSAQPPPAYRLRLPGPACRVPRG